MAFDIMNAISRCKLHIKLDNLTEGDGNCFPRAVAQQCRRQEIQINIEEEKKTVTNHFMSLRKAVCNFMLDNCHPCIESFKT